MYSPMGNKKQDKKCEKNFKMRQNQVDIMEGRSA